MIIQMLLRILILYPVPVKALYTEAFASPKAKILLSLSIGDKQIDAVR